MGGIYCLLYLYLCHLHDQLKFLIVILLLLHDDDITIILVSSRNGKSDEINVKVEY